MPPIFSAGEKNESLSAPAVKAAELGGVFVGADSFSTVQFHTVDAAEKFVAWLNRRFYQARAIIPPNEQCKLFSVSYR